MSRLLRCWLLGFIPLIHSSIHLLNEPCQHSFPFLLLQLLSLNLVIDDAFVFCFLFAYAIAMHGKQTLGRFVRTKFKSSLAMQIGPQTIIFQPHKNSKWSFDTMKYMQLDNVTQHSLQFFSHYQEHQLVGEA